MDNVRPLSDLEFLRFQKLIQSHMGVFLPDHKKTLLNNRLSKRVALRNCKNYSEYYTLVNLPKEKMELEMALEMVTTNETYFFREPKHFDYLRESLTKRENKTSLFRVWCAAASTGEEPYTIAMMLSEFCSTPWELVASDINESVLSHGQKGIYRQERMEGIPYEYLRKYFRKGIGEYENHLRIVPKLRSKVKYLQINLMDELPGIGSFDAIFIRNVMIYFQRETQISVMKKIRRLLKPGGNVFVGHSESLHGIGHEFKMVCPAVYKLDR